MSEIKSYWKLWRKYGAIPLLITQIIGMLISPLLYACIMPLWITLPCGVKIINEKWYLWYPRQLLFGTMAVMAIIDVI